MVKPARKRFLMRMELRHIRNIWPAKRLGPDLRRELTRGAYRVPHLRLTSLAGAGPRQVHTLQGPAFKTRVEMIKLLRSGSAATAVGYD
jgi:hypothetical protein